MKKVIFIVIMCTVAVFSLQGLWIRSLYRAYTDQTMSVVEKAMRASIGKELSFRNKERPFKDLKNPKVVYKYADEMTPEERNSLKGDTLNLNETRQKGIGADINEIIVQIQQDSYIQEKNYIKSNILDSLFQAELHREKVAAKYGIFIYDKDTVVINRTGTLDTTLRATTDTRLFPIGTKGLQFVQVKADIGLSAFLREILYILIASVVMVVVILGCVVYLMVTIRKKDLLFKQREANVNGTVHDLKAPLNGIITLLGFLRNKQTDTSVQTLMDGIVRQAKNLVSDIESLLVTARRDRQQLHLQKKRTDLVQLVAQARESLSSQYIGKPHCIRVECEETEMMAEVDALYVTNVLRNLMENALKYSDDGVEIIVCLRKEASRLCLEVEDNGWGIERKYHKKIFDQFFQVPSEHEVRRRGYGVGLAFAYYIMEAHGGCIRVKSEPGKGSTFTCVFPIK